MKLLDFPPEVFQHIIKAYVDHAGILAAWKLRGVCKTFAIYIAEDVFGAQPIKVYTVNKRTQKLLKKGMALHLEYRSIALLGAHDILPTLIRKAVDKFMQLTGESSSQRRGEYLREASTAAAQYCGWVWNLVTKPSAKTVAKFAGIGDKENALGVAVAMQSEDLVRRLVADGASMWKKTPAFGLPIRIAILSCDTSTVNFVLRHSVATSTDIPLKEQVKLLSAEIDRHLRSTMVPAINTALLQWHIQHLGRPLPRTCDLLFDHGMKTHDKVLLDNLLSLDLSHVKRPYAQSFFDGCGTEWDESANIMNVLLDKKIIDVKKRYFACDIHRGYTSALNCAVFLNSVQLVRRVLEAGAHPDGVDITSENPYMKGVFEDEVARTWPLRTAIENNSIEITDLLLQYQARPEAGNYRTSVCMLKVAQKGSAVRDLLLAALCKQMDRLGDDFILPNSWFQYIGVIHDFKATKYNVAKKAQKG